MQIVTAALVEACPWVGSRARPQSTVIMPVAGSITSPATSMHVAVLIRIATVFQTRVITRQQPAAITVQVDVTVTVQADAMALPGTMAAMQVDIAVTGQAVPLSRARHGQQMGATRGRVPSGQPRMVQMELGVLVACRLMSRVAHTVVPAECIRPTSFHTGTGLRCRNLATPTVRPTPRQRNRLRAHASGLIGTDEELTAC